MEIIGVDCTQSINEANCQGIELCRCNMEHYNTLYLYKNLSFLEKFIYLSCMRTVYQFLITTRMYIIIGYYRIVVDDEKIGFSQQTIANLPFVQDEIMMAYPQSLETELLDVLNTCKNIEPNIAAINHFGLAYTLPTFNICI